MPLRIELHRDGHAYGLTIQGIHASLSIDGATVWAGRRTELGKRTELPPLVMLDLVRRYVGDTPHEEESRE